MKIDFSQNNIICGDNLEWLPLIPDESIDLCYIDPPFFSNRDYEGVLKDTGETASFTDKFKGGVNHYIEWMKPRVELIHKKLKRTGSIFLHCDYHASHRLRCLLDDIFKSENFRNEIIWHRKNGSNATSKSLKFSVNSDTIFFYSKSNKYFFNLPYTKHNENYIEKFYNHDDNDGKGPYQLAPLIAPSDSPTLKYDFMGYKMPPRGWRWTKERMIQAYNEGKLYIPKNKSMQIRQKLYLKEMNGNPVGNIWLDLGMIQGNSFEYIGYPTQKPEALIKRIIECASNEGDIVLDCFAGSGTTAKVASDLNRRFIIGDVSPVAIEVIEQRFNFNPKIHFLREYQHTVSKYSYHSAYQEAS